MRVLLVLAVALFGAPASFAATFPTFTFDREASEIRLYKRDIVCRRCAFDAEFSDGLEDWSWTPDSVTESVTIDNFIDWSPRGTGYGRFRVEVDIAFSSPSVASTTGVGGGQYFTLAGVVSGGRLRWGAIEPLVFSDGSIVDVALEGASGINYRTTDFSTGVTFTGNQISAVPIPASLPLLLGALGALTFAARRRRPI